MKFVSLKHLKWLILGIAFSIFQLNAQIKVNFSEAGQTIRESGSLTIAIELSEPSLLEVSVPFVISAESSMTLDSDYEIIEDDEEKDIDYESPIVFAPGETRKIISVDILNDDVVEEDEFLIFDLVQNGLTVVELGEQTRHRVRVIDNDNINVYFVTHEGEFSEAKNISIPVRMSSTSEQDVNITYEITYRTANTKDVDLSDSYTSDNPIEIKAGTSAGTISVKINNDSVTDRNEGGADRETLLIRMTQAILVDSETSIDVDSEPYIVTIVDNDPLTVEFSYGDDVEQPFDVEEYQNIPVTVRLVDQDGNASETGAEIEIPIIYSGSATRGKDDNSDYESEDDVVSIAAGKSSTSFTLVANNDDIEEGDENIILSIGDAKYKNGGDLWVGDKKNIEFLVKDNDPITLTFGAVYSKDDKAAAEDPDDDIEDKPYVASTGYIVSEEIGSVSIPFFLSSYSANNLEFDIVLKQDGTSAKLYQSGSDEDDWDFAVSNYHVTEFEKEVKVVVRAGINAGSINLTLNNDEETPIVYGQEAPADVEADETVSFEIRNINTDTSFVRMGEASSFTLTIRDTPDIDISSIVNGMSPDVSKFVNGSPRYNERTGLFEVYYDMSLSQQIDPNQFSGYNSLKVQFRTTNYDASNPNADSNDPVLQQPYNPDKDKEFHYYVQTPYQLRYYSNVERIKLIEGADPVDEKYDVTTAHTIETSPYLLKPLLFPRLNDFEAEIENGYQVNEPLKWWIDFYSRGYLTMPLDRIDPAINPDRMRIYLTTESTPFLATGSNSLTIESITPQADGSMLLDVNAGSVSRIQIQYLDAGEEWKIAQPAFIENSGGSHLYWIDKGPPATESHPSTKNFRLYRATSK